jgi:protein-disulfide isomerase
MMKRVDVMVGRFGLAALAVVLAAGFGGLVSGPTFAETAVAPVTSTAVTVPDMIIGNKDSKVTLMEYASFTCPHCAQFHQDVFKQLKKDYIDTGKIKFVYREVYFDRYGLWAAMIARCGGEMRYFGISDILLSTQKDWAGTDDPAVVVENLKKIGRTAGMEDAAMGACLDNADMAQAMVTAYQTNAEADKVEGTPTLLVNGVKYSNMPYAELKTILDAELAK